MLFGFELEYSIDVISEYVLIAHRQYLWIALLHDFTEQPVAGTIYPFLILREVSYLILGDDYFVGFHGLSP